MARRLKSIFSTGARRTDSRQGRRDAKIAKKKICISSLGDLGVLACLAQFSRFLPDARRIVAAIFAAVMITVLARAQPPAPTSRPLTTATPIDFVRDVAPIFQSSCVQCHANGRHSGNLHIDTLAGMLKGGDSNGPVIVPGHSDQSLLVSLIKETDADVVMPKKGRHLSPEQIATVSAWIDRGASWPDKFILGRFKESPLAPRRPVIPVAAPGSDLTNPIDLILQTYFAANHVVPAEVVSDRLFARRVYLDVVGLLPSEDQVNAFAADASADKRSHLVHSLLGDDRRYAEHWLSFWNDLLRNDYRGTGYVDGGRKQITEWLFHALETRLPFDQFVRELINGTDGAAGFTKGIIWRGVVNSSQTPQMQSAQNISQVFLGINLKCASCHDSFVSNWKLTDSYGFAAIFADGPLAIERCSQPTGATASPKFLFDSLGSIDAAAPKKVRINQLAIAMTNANNGRLNRTIVNRLWQRLMGRGLIEPTDDMDSDAWDQDVLDELAIELTENGYDLRKTIETIMTSRAYQLPAVPQQGERDDAFVFHGPLVRRLSAEQFVDAVSTMTGVWPQKPATRPVGEGFSDAVPVRAAFCPADPLTSALGRPNREQVVTERSSAATTLQGLEMTNGVTLTTMLRDGSVKLMAKNHLTTDAIIRSVYARALGRDPSNPELKTARDALGPAPKVDDVQDFLWAVAMLPEFQLVR